MKKPNTSTASTGTTLKITVDCKNNTYQITKGAG